MPKQRTIDVRIAELEEHLKRLKIIQKIEQLQEQLPKQRRRR